jgi:hypothetical protein
MAILDEPKLVNHLVSWLKTQAQQNGLRAFYVLYSPFINSLVTAHLCKRTGIRTTLILTEDNKNVEIFCNDYALPIEKMLHDGSIYTTAGGIHFLADKDKGAWIGANSRNTLSFYGYLNSLVESTVDLELVGDLFDSELISLYQDFTNLKYYDRNSVEKFILQDQQELDLKSALKPSEVEWADQENQRNIGVVSSKVDPAKNKLFFTYTSRQKEVIAHLHQKDKQAQGKYKAKTLICPVRTIEGLVI